jgi:hypoxia-inducible factor 1-alpha inhibitor (HIF hydroxylase)
MHIAALSLLAFPVALVAGAAPAWVDLTQSKEIAREVWGVGEVSDERRVAQILQRRQPVILTGSPLVRCAALERWSDPAYISSKVPTLAAVRRQNSSGSFVYEDFTRLMGKQLLGETPVGLPLQDKISVNTADFLAGRDERDAYLYYSHVLDSEPGFAPIAADVAPLKLFEHTDAPDALTARDSSTNVWISRGGIAAGAHYDPTHNFFAQISGQKHFLVFAPDSAQELKVYPFFHPRDRQSQLPDSGPTGMNATARAAPWEATLSPGEVLYLPPYWLHRVEAVGTSISVNVWSSSLEGAFSRFVHSHKLPAITDECGPSQACRLRVLAYYVRRLVERLRSTPAEPLQFLRRVADGRYHSMQEYFACSPGDQWTGDKCPRAGPTQREVAAVDASVRAVVGRSRGEFGAVQAGIRDSVVADYVERCVAFVVGVENSCRCNPRAQALACNPHCRGT